MSPSMTEYSTAPPPRRDDAPLQLAWPELKLAEVIEQAHRVLVVVGEGLRLRAQAAASSALITRSAPSGE